MDPEMRKIDALNSALCLLCLLAGGGAFALAASRSTFSGWLTPTVCGATLWVVAYHLRKLGRLY